LVVFGLLTIHEVVLIVPPKDGFAHVIRIKKGEKNHEKKLKKEKKTLT
jgi:hypothetical protein